MKHPTDGTRPYVCNTCQASGVKLWRDYNTMACFNDLSCGDCAAKKDGCEPPDEDGKVLDRGGVRSMTIGWLVPAVPTDDNTTFWGFSSVPEKGVFWWKSLPTRKS